MPDFSEPDKHWLSELGVDSGDGDVVVALVGTVDAVPLAHYEAIFKPDGRPAVKGFPQGATAVDFKCLVSKAESRLAQLQKEAAFLELWISRSKDILYSNR